jgi:hypothetical protein
VTWWRIAERAEIRPEARQFAGKSEIGRKFPNRLWPRGAAAWARRAVCGGLPGLRGLESGIHGEFRSSADSIRISDAAAGAVAATDRANGLSYEPGPTEGDMSRIAGLPERIAIDGVNGRQALHDAPHPGRVAPEKLGQGISVEEVLEPCPGAYCRGPARCPGLHGAALIRPKA